MYLKYQAKALYKLLKKRQVWFDHKSYDCPNDIPFIIIGNKRYRVDGVHFVEEGILDIHLSDNILTNITINFRNIGLEDDEFDIELQRYELSGLFRDIYYETEDSWEIGDYELDFLGLLEENI